MVTTLYLIRHGETEGGDTKRYKGSIDVPLSARGVEQAGQVSVFLSNYVKNANVLKLASYLEDIHGSGGRCLEEEQVPAPPEEENKRRYELPGLGLGAIYCSGLSRALKSAEMIAEPHGLKPVIFHDLRERSFGIWEGMSFLEIKEKYPSEFEAWAENPLRYSPPDGEATAEIHDRAVAVLDRILFAHQGEQVAIVAHGGVNRIILCHILGIPLENIFRIEQDYAALNIIEFWERYPVVRVLNLTPAHYGGLNG